MQSQRKEKEKRLRFSDITDPVNSTCQNGISLSITHRGKIIDLLLVETKGIISLNFLSNEGKITEC